MLLVNTLLLANCDLYGLEELIIYILFYPVHILTIHVDIEIYI